MNTALLIFTKAAEPGLSKTRLIPALGAVQAAAAHETLSQRVFRAVVGSQLSIVLWGASAHPSLARWAEQYGWPLRRQRGDDLGQRMFHALASALADGAASLCAAGACGVHSGTTRDFEISRASSPAPFQP